MSQSTPAVPRCLGIIMDGNRRWAKERELPTLEGHRAGYEKLKEVLRWTKDLGIGNLVIFGFSTENWNRSKDEVSYLMDLIRFILKSEIDHFHKEGGVLKCVGFIERFPEDIKQLITEAEE